MKNKLPIQMRNVLAFFAFLLGVNPSFAQIKSASLTASGLTCSMCSKSIFKALEKLPSVQSIEVDIDNSIFEIKFKEAAQVRPDDIKNAVVDAGFAVALLKMTAVFPKTILTKDVHLNYEGAIYHVLNANNQSISGEQTFTLVDKSFVSNSAFRKYKKMTSMTCIETGKAQSCCSKNLTEGIRIYHITF
jgi:copper chaperone CopZ